MISAVRVEKLNFSYADAKPVLNGITFSVPEGESFGVIGPNGAGKSTMLLHLNGILPEKKTRSPSIYIYDRPICEETLENIRRTVGVLFQNPDDQLFCPTVYEDVAFGPQQFGIPKEAVMKIVGDCLAKVGLQGFERRPPHHLSRGEKQRVCLAGVLACQPKILVLDEPTSDLDPRGKRDLIRLLKTISATKIIASHDLELVFQLCSRTIVIDKGEVVAEGITSDILSNEVLMLEHGLEKPHILLHAHPHASA